MRDQLYKDQLRWVKMLKAATPGACINPPTLELVDPVVIHPLEVETQDLGGCQIETETNAATTAAFTTGFGECIVCHKEKRIWSGVCAMCGADDDDLEEE